MTHADRRPAAETRTGRDPKWWTLVAVCLGVFILLLDITIVNVALADIQGELDASLSDLQWVIDAYALSLAALLLTAGSLADLYGRRLVFVIGTALFMVGSIACGAAQDIYFLQLARAFQGIGGAAMFATALALIASALPGPRPRRRVRRLRRDHRRRRGRRPGARRRAHQRPLVALDLLRQHPDLPARDRHRRHPGPRVARPARRAPGLVRLRHLQPRARRAGLRPDPGRADRVGRRPRGLLPGGGGGAAGGLRGQPAGAERPDVRPRRCSASRRSPAG